jgi:WD40 repeat protein
MIRSVAALLLIGVAFSTSGLCLGQEAKCRVTLESDNGRVLSLTFSPDSKMVASGTMDGTIKLWELSTGKVRAIFRKNNAILGSVAFSPNGKLLASGGWDKEVRLWDGGSSHLRHQQDKGEDQQNDSEGQGLSCRCAGG